MQVVVAAAICRGGRLLVAQRAHPAEIRGLWELPGGKLEPDEQELAALGRECREELGVELEIGDRVGSDVLIKDGWILRAYAARLHSGEPKPLEHLELRWTAADELSALPWVPANAALLPDLCELLRAAA